MVLHHPEQPEGPDSEREGHQGRHHSHDGEERHRQRHAAQHARAQQPRQTHVAYGVRHQRRDEDEDEEDRPRPEAAELLGLTRLARPRSELTPGQRVPQHRDAGQHLHGQDHLLELPYAAERLPDGVEHEEARQGVDQRHQPWIEGRARQAEHWHERQHFEQAAESEGNHGDG